VLAAKAVMAAKVQVMAVAAVAEKALLVVMDNPETKAALEQLGKALL
jgi:hypothetical protein